MINGDIISAVIDKVRLHKEERKQIGALYGNYQSQYIAFLEGYSNGIVCIDSIAQQLHPNWERKTEQRSQILSQELHGETIKVRIIDIFYGGAFEAELI
jgi:hypothetical protein